MIALVSMVTTLNLEFLTFTSIFLQHNTCLINQGIQYQRIYDHALPINHVVYKGLGLKRIYRIFEF